MAHVITKFMQIGGDVGKIFYNVELIMIIYMNKIANELIINYLELTRCFCDVLLNTSFYIQSNLYRVDGFFDCLRNTITHSHEFITKGLLDKMFNLSEYIFPHEQTKPSLITSYCAMLSHFIGNSKYETKSNSGNSSSSSSNNNYVNYFFDVLLKHMKKFGYDDETAKCGDTNNDMVMSIEDDNNNNIETLRLCNDNMEISDISLHKHYNTYLTIFHYIKILHVYDLIPLLNNTNRYHLLISFLGFFSNHLQKHKSNNIIQQIAKLILLIMVDYIVKPNTHVNKNIKNDTLHNKIKNLSFSPLVIETLISAVVITNTFDDKLNFNVKDMNITFNTRDISYKQIILLFQVVYAIMFQNVKELLQQRGECALTDYIETYYVLYKCFESVLNVNNDSDSDNSFYNEFFTETQCFMEQTYTRYFSLFIEDEDTFEQCSSYQISSSIDKSKFNITYNEFKSQLIQNFIHISQRLILGHMNPFIYKAMISRGKDATIHCILDIIIHLMEFFIDNASSSSTSSELNKFYISNLISFYARLNYALCCCQSDIIVKFIYKRHVKLFCKFLNIFKETHLLYSLIGIDIGNARLMLLSEIVFDNYVNMYLINTDHDEDEHTRKFICDEFPKMVFNIKQPVTQSNNEDNVVDYLTTICYYVDHQSKNKEIHSSLTEIHELLVERKFTMLTGVNISLLFVIKSLLYIHSLHNTNTTTNSDISCSSLIDKLEKFSSLLIKELIDNQSTKIANTKDPFYNRFIDVIKTKTKKQNTKQPIDIYNQLLDICKSQYQVCGDELLTYNAFDVNNTTNKRTPIRKYTKTQTNALSPQQKTNLNLSADVNKHKKMQISTTSLTTFRTESSSRDEGKGRTTSLIFDNNDYGVNSSNDGSDYQLVEDDSKDNKYGGWFSKKANSNNSNSNSNSNSKKKRRDNRSTTTMGLKYNFLSRKFLIENSNSNNKKVIDNIYDEQSFKEINNNFSLLNPKRQLLLSHFALEFKNIYFYSESFIKMKHAYFKHTNLPSIRKSTKQLNYPSKIKNFSNTIEPPLFFTYNKHFFNGKYFDVSHQYINKRSNINENRIPFQQRHFPINNNNIHRYEYKCELITTEYSLYGVITLCKDFIVFQSNINDPRLHKNPEERLKYVFSSAKGDRVIKQRMKCIFYDDIKEMLIRRYLFLWQSIEIFTKDGKSCYFNFFTESNCNEFIKTLPKDSIKARNASVVLLLDKKELYTEMERYSKKWNDNELSTYEYLLCINKYASRSYKEVNQYPIMPWLLNDYNSIFDFNVGMITKKESKDNKSKAMNNGYVFEIEQPTVNASVNTVDIIFKNNFRDLNYPISVQTSDKRNSAISRYRESKEEKKFACHLGSFYSTSSFIFYYLMRMQPFMDCLIRLQNGVQENTNRMFYSIADTQEVLENSTDNRELIPEFYACIECFINLNCSFFGYKTKKKLVDDIEFNDKRLSTYVQFIIAHRKLLNTYKISQSVLKWIDYTFGVNQFALKEQNCTVFQKSSYAQKVNFVNKIQSIKKKNQIKNNGVINYEDVFRKVTDKILVVMNFGQAPFQIFNSALSQRKENGNEIFVESKLFGGNNDDDSDNSDNDMNDNENEEGQNDILMMLMLMKRKDTIQRELVIKPHNEIICGCYIDSINSNNNKKDTTYSLASNGHLIINYDIITNQKIKNALYIKLPGFTLKNRTNVNRMIKSNESINYPEYSFCIMNKQKFIVTVGYLSNAFQLYDLSDKDKKYKFYIMEDFVRSICKTSEHVFLIGLNNGRLLEYEIQYKHNDTTFMSHECKCKRFIYAHSSSICVIEYIPRLNIIITVGDDNYIYIRKYFDFELLSYISLDSKYKVLSLKVSDVNCVYVLVYDKTQSVNKMKVIGYTLTGIEFAESEYGMYTNMEITTSNNVILGVDGTATQSNSNDNKKKMNHIMVLKGCSLERIGYMRLMGCEKKSVVYVKYYAKKKMLFYYFKDDIRVSQLEDGEKEIMVF